VNKTLRQTLVWLAKQEAIQQQDYGLRDRECHEQIRSRHNFQPINERTLEALFAHAPHAGDLHCWGTWLFLPAPRRGPLRIPLLNVIYDYSRTPPAVSMQAAFFYPDDEGSLAAGWRFESPERQGEAGEESTHGYYHVQPGHRLRTLRGDYPLPVAVGAGPEGQPTFPLDAENEVDLLICLLLSIYGLKEGGELIRDTSDPDLERRFGQLRTFGPQTCVDDAALSTRAPG
jgi:hypothetical protein